MNSDKKNPFKSIEEAIGEAVQAAIASDKPRREICEALGIPDTVEDQAEWLIERGINPMEITSQERLQDLIERHRHISLAVNHERTVKTPWVKVLSLKDLKTSRTTAARWAESSKHPGFRRVPVAGSTHYEYEIRPDLVAEYIKPERLKHYKTG